MIFRSHGQRSNCLSCPMRYYSVSYYPFENSVYMYVTIKKKSQLCYELGSSSILKIKWNLISYRHSLLGPSHRKQKVGCSNPSRLAIGMSVSGPRRWSLHMDALCQNRCGTFKNPRCSMAIGAEYIWKFAVLHRHMYRLQMSQKFSCGTKNSKQTNKNTIWNAFLYTCYHF